MTTPAPAPPFPKLAYTMKEAAAASGIARTQLYEDIKAGTLQIRKRGSHTLILAGELARYLEALPEGERGNG